MLRTVAVVIQEPVALFEYGVAHEVFGIDRREDGVPPFDLRICSLTPGTPLDSGNGAFVVAPHPLSAADDVDLVIVPGGPTDGDHPEQVLDLLRSTVDRGARVLSVCTGAFVLAAAGLLDGRRATTHWRYGDKLARAHPDITVDTDVLFVDDPPVITSAGTAAGIDACLHLVREELGPSAVNAIARRMVVAPHRDGGQRQFVSAPVPECPDEGLGPILTWMRDHLTETVTVADLARRTHMSPRTFARRFADETGTTPHKWLTEQRILAARELLEVDTLSMDEVADRVGFGSATLLRHHFATSVGVSPSTYRRRFSTQGSSPQGVLTGGAAAQTTPGAGSSGGRADG